MNDRIKVRILREFWQKDPKIIQTITSQLKNCEFEITELHYYSCFDMMYEFICESFDSHIQNNSGYIYLCQLGDQDVYKVGLTTLLPEDRVKQLNNESTIEEIRLLRFWKVLDVHTFEAFIHMKLKKKFPKKKEFFFGNFDAIAQTIGESIRILLKQYQVFERDTVISQFKF